MLRAVYTEKVSVARNLAARLRNAPGEDTLSSGHTFYRDGVEVAHMYNYLSGPSRIEIGNDLFLFKRKNVVVLFTQHYMLEHEGKTVATAKELIMSFYSKSTINCTIESRELNLTLKTNVRNLTGRRYRITDGRDEIGI